MVFLHIDTKNYDTKDETGDTPINTLNKFITSGKNVFILIYMEGCGPCNATRPEWKKLENTLKKEISNSNEIIVVDIDKDLLDNVKKIKTQPKGFPTIRFISNKGEISEDFEDSKLSEENKKRNIDSFVKWIELKLDDKSKKLMGGRKLMGEKLMRIRKKSKSKRQKGGKWSLKYKKSINCKRPKGFSQKQYCKYTRKRH
jgi:thiol-disulfide isomerase/thioredoxin